MIKLDETILQTKTVKSIMNVLKIMIYEIEPMTYTYLKAEEIIKQYEKANDQPKKGRP